MRLFSVVSLLVVACGNQLPDEGLARPEVPLGRSPAAQQTRAAASGLQMSRALGAADPWDPASCAGPLISMDELHRVRGSESSLGRWSTVVRYRDCRRLWTDVEFVCSDWREDGDAQLADASDLTGSVYMEVEHHFGSDSYYLRLLSDTRCGGEAFGSRVDSINWPPIAMSATHPTRPQPWHGSPCVARELPLVPSSRDANLTTECLRFPMRGVAYSNTDTEAHYREWETVILAGFTPAPAGLY